MALRTKLVLVMVLLACALGGWVAVYFPKSVAENAIAERRARAVVATEQTATSAQQSAATTDPWTTMVTWAERGPNIAYVALVDGRDRVTRVWPAAGAADQRLARTSAEPALTAQHTIHTRAPFIMDGPAADAGDLYVHVGFDITDIRERSANDMLKSLGVIGVMLLFGVSFAFVFGTWLVRPLKEVVLAARAFGRGDWTARAEVSGAKEASALARAFNVMADRIRESVAAQQQAAEETRERKQFTESIFASLLDAVLVVDPDGVVADANPAVGHLVDKHPTRIVGRPAAELLAEGGEIFSAEHLAIAARESQIRDRDLVFRNASGGEIPVVAHLSAIRDDQQGVMAFVLVARDMRETKRLMRAAADAEAERRRSKALESALAELDTANRELAVAKEQAIAASGAKSSFLANMSHEIRTPINGVLGFADLLMEADLQPDHAHLVRMLRESGRALRTVINDVLDLSKIEAGKLELDPQPFDLRACVDDTLETFAIAVGDKGVALIGDIAPELPAQVTGDGARVRQILTNLLSNAIKFTASGEVAVQVRVAEVNDGEVTVDVAVRDTGIGISEEQLAIIFEPFQQAEGSTSRRFGGTGLGLAISARFVEMMGGRLQVQSTVGVGSVFSFTLTLPCVAARWQPKRLDVTNVLVVDDNAARGGAVASYLGHAGASVVLRIGAAAGIAEIAPPKAYDAVVVTEEIGVAGVAQIGRALAAQPHGPKLVMVLPLHRRSRCEAGYAKLGVGGFVYAPIRADAVVNAVSSVLATRVRSATSRDHKRPTAPGAESSAPPRPVSRPITKLVPARPLRILLAEDYRMNQVLAVRILERWGHEVVIANHGGEAVEHYIAGRFDLVLMDLQMPVVDGLTATTQIRAFEAERGGRTPIVALTAHAMKQHRDECAAHDMDGFVTKPIQTPTLFAEIERVVAVAPSPSRADAANDPPGEDIEASRSAAPTVGPFDPEELLARFAGDASLALAAIELFEAEVSTMIGTVRDAVDADDAPAARMAAHRLRGFVGVFGKCDPYVVSGDIERLARACDVAGARRLVPRLTEGMRSLQRELSRVGPQLSDRSVMSA